MVVSVINHVYFRLQRGAYVSERNHDGDADGAEEQDHAQGEQDTLAGRDVNLGHINTLLVLWRDLRRAAACVVPHLALEAEEGDRKTHQSRDAQTQKHRFGVVEAERRGSRLEFHSGTLVLSGHYLDLPRHESHHKGHAQGLNVKTGENMTQFTLV